MTVLGGLAAQPETQAIDRRRKLPSERGGAGASTFLRRELPCYPGIPGAPEKHAAR